MKVLAKIIVSVVVGNNNEHYPMGGNVTIKVIRVVCMGRYFMAFVYRAELVHSCHILVCSAVNLKNLRFIHFIII